MFRSDFELGMKDEDETERSGGQGSLLHQYVKRWHLFPEDCIIHTSMFAGVLFLSALCESMNILEYQIRGMLHV
ncbi:hypothetical protein GCWU000246_00970 [Jonquetella anthropi E3_33 E1]|nr:hypothetical protein GCWU000246_00970 [Jonquetella anthropi E3_33 E1]